MTKKKKNMRGRPKIMTQDVLRKLEECFKKGYNDYEAYNSVGISHDTFYAYKKSNLDFSEKIEFLKNNTKIIAKEVVYGKLLEKDVLTAKWLLERKAKDEFSTRVEQSGIDGKDLVPTVNLILNQ